MKNKASNKLLSSLYVLKYFENELSKGTDSWGWIGVISDSDILGVISNTRILG